MVTPATLGLTRNVRNKDNMGNVNPSWGTVKEAAKRSGLHTMTIRRYIAAGRLPAQRVGVKLIRVDLNAVDKLTAPVSPETVAAK